MNENCPNLKTATSKNENATEFSLWANSQSFMLESKGSAGGLNGKRSMKQPRQMQETDAAKFHLSDFISHQ